MVTPITLFKSLGILAFSVKSVGLLLHTGLGAVTHDVLTKIIFFCHVIAI